MKKRITFICLCRHTQRIDEETRQTITTIQHTENRPVVLINDLCAMAARDRSALLTLLETGEHKIFACQPRAVKGMLQWRGWDSSNENVEFFNLNESQSQPLEVLREHGLVPGTVKRNIISACCDWIPWFPVIDGDRCKDCKQCVSFCLFGVYATDDQGRVFVKNPSACKTNCPACARVCPEAAIMFPKSEESPINGEKITDEDAVRATIKVNVEEMLGDNVYEALAQRRQKAKRILLKKQALTKAEEERKACVLKDNLEGQTDNVSVAKTGTE